MQGPIILYHTPKSGHVSKIHPMIAPYDLQPRSPHLLWNSKSHPFQKVKWIFFSSGSISFTLWRILMSISFTISEETLGAFRNWKRRSGWPPQYSFTGRYIDSGIPLDRKVLRWWIGDFWMHHSLHGHAFHWPKWGGPFQILDAFHPISAFYLDWRSIRH